MSDNEKDNIEDLIPGMTKCPEVDWTPDILAAITHLILTDREFLFETKQYLNPAYLPVGVIRWTVEFAYRHADTYTSMPPREIVYDAAREKWKDRPEDLSDAEWELDRIYDYVLHIAKERDYLTKKVTDFCRQVAYKTVCQQGIEILSQKEKGNTRFEEFERLFEKARLVGVPKAKGVWYFETLEARYKEKAERLKFGLDKMRTGYQSIDLELQGGFNRQEAVMFAAAAKRGKSFQLLHMAKVAVADGKKTLIITLENSQLITSDRIDSALSKRPTRDLMDDWENVTIQILKKWAEIHPKSLHIVEFPGGQMSIGDLKSYQKSLESQYGWVPDVVVLDYIDEVKRIPDLNTHDSQIENVLLFKGWVQELNGWGITATQMNREGSKVEIADEGELADAYGKIRKVDWGASLNLNDADRVLGLCRMYVMAARNGRSKYMIYLKADFSSCQFSEISEEDYKLQHRDYKDKVSQSVMTGRTR